MPAGRPKSIDDTKVFDVAKPGKSKPVESARPVILNRNNIVKDQTILEPTALAPSITRKVINPVSADESDAVSTDAETSVKPSSTSIMVLQDSNETNTTAPLVPVTADNTLLVPDAASQLETTAVSAVAMTPSLKITENGQDVTPAQGPPVVPKGMKRELRLTPPSEMPTSNQLTGSSQSTATSTENVPLADAITEPATEVQNNDDTAAAATEEMTPDTDDNQAPAASDAATVDALAESSDKPKEQRKAEEEELKKEEALNEMIASKKYFVPLAHDSTQKGSNKSALIVLLAFIILLAGAYLAIDAKVLKLNVALPYHFFK